MSDDNGIRKITHQNVREIAEIICNFIGGLKKYFLVITSSEEHIPKIFRNQSLINGNSVSVLINTPLQSASIDIKRPNDPPLHISTDEKMKVKPHILITENTMRIYTYEDRSGRIEDAKEYIWTFQIENFVIN